MWLKLESLTTSNSYTIRTVSQRGFSSRHEIAKSNGRQGDQRKIKCIRYRPFLNNDKNGCWNDKQKYKATKNV